MSRAVDIVIVAYKSEEDLPRLLEDLGRMNRVPYRVHLYDNTENKKTLTMLWNDLGRHGTGAYVSFLNTDIRISPEWDIRLIDALERDSAVGVALPRPVGHDWPTLVNPKAKPFARNHECPPPGPKDMTRIAEVFQEERGVGGFAGCDAAFYATLMRRDLWERMKGFDERHRFYGQDHDFQRRLRARTGKLAATVFNAPVWHKCGGSVRKALGEVDLNGEMIHNGQVSQAIHKGDLKAWDLMDDTGRDEVRRDPRYNRMPLFEKRP